MGAVEIMEKALSLKTSERYELLELLRCSLDKPDAEIDAVWLAEAEHRLQAIREGRLSVISQEEAFREL